MEIEEAFSTRVRRLHTGDVIDTTWRVLESFDMDVDARQELFGPVHAAVQHVIRQDTRAVERRVFRRVGARRVIDMAGPQPVEYSIEKLLNMQVSVAGKMVTWGEMTVEQHQTRVHTLQRQVDGMKDTISRHDWAIHELQSHHVTCLNDIAIDVLDQDLVSLTA